MKKINYWKCLKCKQIVNSNNVKTVPIRKKGFPFDMLALKCPYCKTIDQPFNKQNIGVNKTKGFLYLKTENLTDGWYDMKTKKNRLGNAFLMSFMASVGWFFMAIFVGGFIFAIQLGGIMFLCLFIVFCILMFNDERLDFLSKGW